MFKTISIKNFKSFKHFDYQCAKLNLLTGLNGSGKSSFIQALRAVNLCRDDRTPTGKKFTIALNKIGLKDQSDLFYAYNAEESVIVSQFENVGLDLVLTRGAKDDCRVETEKYGVALPVRMRFLSSDRRAVAIEDFDAEQDVENIRGEGAVTGLGTDFNDCPREVNPVLRRTDCEVGSLQEQLNAWLGVVSPDAYYNFDKDADSVYMHVGYSKRDPQAPLFRASNVGYGISYVYPILMLLLSAQPNDVIVLENPEAHLHPRGQAMIGELIARAVAAGAQLFVETHSDHVINGMRVAVKKGIIKPQDVNIGFFDCREHEVYGETYAPTVERWTECTNIKVDGNGSLSDYPDSFMDEWSNQMIELMK